MAFENKRNGNGILVIPELFENFIKVMKSIKNIIISTKSNQIDLTELD